MYFKNNFFSLIFFCILSTYTMCMFKQLISPNTAKIVPLDEASTKEYGEQMQHVLAENERCHATLQNRYGYEDLINTYDPQLPATQEEQELVAMFVALKEKEAIAKDVPLLFTTEPSTTTAQAVECTEGQFMLILVHKTQFLKYTHDARNFFLAHELGHIAKKHVAVIPEEIFTDKKEQSKLHHAMEFEADQYAAHLLGGIAGGLSYFGAQCDAACTKIIAQPDKRAFISTHGHPCRVERAYNLINFLAAALLKNPDTVKGLDDAARYCPHNDTVNMHPGVAQEADLYAAGNNSDQATNRHCQ